MLGQLIYLLIDTMIDTRCPFENVALLIFNLLAMTENINNKIAGAMIRIVFADANLYGTGQIIWSEIAIVS